MMIYSPAIFGALPQNGTRSLVSFDVTYRDSLVVYSRSCLVDPTTEHNNIMKTKREKTAPKAK